MLRRPGDEGRELRVVEADDRGHPPLATGAARLHRLAAGADEADGVGEVEGARGVTTFIEVGPGQVLTGLIKRIAPDAQAIALDDRAAADRLAIPFADAAAVDG